MLTDDERALLRKVHRDIGYLIASPAHAIASYRTSGHTGGGSGFDFRYTRETVTGWWWQWNPVEWTPDGRPSRWEQGELLRTVTITYDRLRKWAESLPADVRDQAATWYRVHLTNTRDLPKLHALVLEQLADEQPALFDLP